MGELLETRLGIVINLLDETKYLIGLKRNLVASELLTAICQEIIFIKSELRDGNKESETKGNRGQMGYAIQMPSQDSVQRSFP